MDMPVNQENVCVHITFNPDQISKERQDQALNVNVYVSIVGFFWGGLLSACYGQCGQMCGLCVCIWIL